MAVCWIGIGANTGEPRAAFALAWRLLAQHPQIELLTRSGLYSTTPVGQHAGDTFTNGVFSLATDLFPLDLLDLLQGIETEIGRTRTLRWGPRPIDLDLLFVDQLTLNEPRLTIPHPAAWYRRFVIDPLFEIAPELVHPVYSQSVAALRDRLLVRPLRVGLCGSLPEGAASAEFRERIPEVRFDGGAISRPQSDTTAATIRVRLHHSEPAEPIQQGVPVADLTQTPGDELQRLTDFVTSVLDSPVRIEDW